MPALSSHTPAAFFLCLTLVLTPGCGGDPAVASEGDCATLTVFAAASLGDVVRRIAETFDQARVRSSMGPSSGLARQIQDGAPADVFLSASRNWVDWLREAGLLAGEPVEVARSRLVCVAAPGSSLAGAAPTDLAGLREHLQADDRVALADPGVPAGEYARQSLGASGDLEWLEPHLVGQVDVRAVLRVVADGHVTAGFVYATDARVMDATVLFELDPDTHDPVAWYAAVVGHAREPVAARAFVQFLQGETGRGLLREAGFEVSP